MQFYQIPRTLSLGKDRNPCEVPFNWAIARPRFSNFYILKFVESKMAFKFLFSILTLTEVILRLYFIWYCDLCVNNRRTKHQPNCRKIHKENLHDPSNIICYIGWMKKKKKKQSRKTNFYIFESSVFSIRSSVSHYYRTLDWKCYEKLSICSLNLCWDCTENKLLLQ